MPKSGEFRLEGKEPVYYPSQEELDLYFATGELPIDIDHPSKFPELDHFTIMLGDKLDKRKPSFAEVVGTHDDITLRILDSTHPKPEKSLELDSEGTLTELRVEWHKKEHGYHVEIYAIYQEY